MGKFLESVINQAWKPPVPIRIEWSNTIFQDARVAAEDRKAGVSMGALSHQTWREEAGFNDALEQTRKQQEGDEAEKNPAKFRPPFDAAHGDTELKSKGGKPAGPKDGDNTNS